MAIASIVLNVIIILILLFYKRLEHFFAQKGKDDALKEDSREIGYENKKGENLATKEDIEDLTRKIEAVKNEVSFENQRRHDFINQRTDRLLNILYHTEKLNEYQSILLYSLYDYNSADRLTTLIEQINETLLNFLHECRIAWITTQDKDISSRITDLVQEAQAYAAYMCYIASNASSYMNNYQNSLELAYKNNYNQQLLEEAIKNREGVDKTRKEFEDNIGEKRNALYDKQINYLSKLNILFGSDFHIKS